MSDVCIVNHDGFEVEPFYGVLIDTKISVAGQREVTRDTT